MSDEDRNMWDEADRRKLKVFIPDDRLLTVDLDDQKKLNEQVLEIIQRYRAIPPEMILKTKSQNGGTHVYLKLDHGHDLVDRICMQLALGSDPVREALAFTRTLYSSNRTPLTLFETDQEAKRVAEFLGRGPDTRSIETVTDD